MSPASRCPGAVGGELEGHLQALQDVGKYLAGAGIIVNHQGAQRVGQADAAGPFRFVGEEFEGQLEGKLAAVAGLAADTDLAAELVDDAFADRQAKAGAAVFASGRGIGLGKGGE